MVKVDDFVQSSLTKLDGLLSEGSQVVSSELKQNLRVVFKEALNRMDVMSREEFEIQTNVLAKTRAKLTELESRLAKLESEPSQSAN